MQLPGVFVALAVGVLVGVLASRQGLLTLVVPAVQQPEPHGVVPGSHAHRRRLLLLRELQTPEQQSDAREQVFPPPRQRAASV